MKSRRERNCRSLAEIAIVFMANFLGTTGSQRRPRGAGRHCPGETQFDDLNCRELLDAGRAQRPYGFFELHFGLAPPCLGSARVRGRRRRVAYSKSLSGTPPRVPRHLNRSKHPLCFFSNRELDRNPPISVASFCICDCGMRCKTTQNEPIFPPLPQNDLRYACRVIGLRRPA